MTTQIDAGLARTLFSVTLHAIVYFWLMPAYIAFYTLVPQAAGGRLYSDTMGRLTFIMFLRVLRAGGACTTCSPIPRSAPASSSCSPSSHFWSPCRPC